MSPNVGQKWMVRGHRALFSTTSPQHLGPSRHFSFFLLQIFFFIYFFFFSLLDVGTAVGITSSHSHTTRERRPCLTKAGREIDARARTSLSRRQRPSRDLLPQRHQHAASCDCSCLCSQHTVPTKLTTKKKIKKSSVLTRSQTSCPALYPPSILGPAPWFFHSCNLPLCCLSFSLPLLLFSLLSFFFR